MKRLALIVLLVLIGSALMAATEIMVDASGTPRLVSEKRPLPTTATGSTNVLTGVASQTIYTLSSTSTPTTIIALPGRTSIQIRSSSGTFQIRVGSTTIEATSNPTSNYDWDWPASIPIVLQASPTAPVIVDVQQGAEQ